MWIAGWSHKFLLVIQSHAFEGAHLSTWWYFFIVFILYFSLLVLFCTHLSLLILSLSDAFLSFIRESSLYTFLGNVSFSPKYKVHKRNISTCCRFHKDGTSYLCPLSPLTQAKQLQRQTKWMLGMGTASGQIQSMKLQDFSKIQGPKNMMRSTISLW